MSLCRYHTDGSPDSAFGKNGLVTFEDTRQNHITSAAGRITFDDNGNILVAGQLDFTTALWRFKNNGALDNSFGNNGYVTIREKYMDRETYGNKQDIVIDQQGRILIKGFYSIPVDDMISVRNMIAARFTRDGSLDTTFGKNGVVNSDFANEVLNGNGSVVRSDGSILMAFNGFRLYRYTEDGSRDTAAADSGYAVFRPNDRELGYGTVTDMITRNKEIIIMGNATGHGNVQRMVLWRLPETNN